MKINENGGVTILSLSLSMTLLDLFREESSFFFFHLSFLTHSPVFSLLNRDIQKNLHNLLTKQFKGKQVITLLYSTNLMRYIDKTGGWQLSCSTKARTPFLSNTAFQWTKILPRKKQKQKHFSKGPTKILPKKNTFQKALYSFNYSNYS